MTLSIQATTATTMCDTLVDLVDTGGTGTLKIYDGTPPTNVDTALSGNTLLATLTMSATAFLAASAGVSAADTITDDSSADATGTASFFRLLDGAATARIQGTVTATSGGGDLELSTVSIVTAVVVSVSSLTITVPIV